MRGCAFPQPSTEALTSLATILANSIGLKGCAFKTFAAIADAFERNDCREVSLSTPHLQRLTGYSHGAVANALKTLDERGAVIRISARGGGTNSYRVPALAAAGTPSSFDQYPVQKQAVPRPESDQYPVQIVEPLYKERARATDLLTYVPSPESQSVSQFEVQLGKAVRDTFGLEATREELAALRDRVVAEGAQEMVWHFFVHVRRVLAKRDNYTLWNMKALLTIANKDLRPFMVQRKPMQIAARRDESQCESTLSAEEEIASLRNWLETFGHNHEQAPEMRQRLQYLQTRQSHSYAAVR